MVKITFRKVVYPLLLACSLALGASHCQDIYQKKEDQRKLQLKYEKMAKAQQIRSNIGDIVLTKEKKDIFDINDVQKLLGVNVDGKLGNQTNYALDSLLIDIEKEHRIPFERENRMIIEQKVYTTLNRPDITLNPNNIEAVAFQHYGSYIMNSSYIKKNPQIIHTKEQAHEYMEVRYDFFEQSLLAFKTAMNYKYNISMPINSKLDQTTLIALNYAHDKGLDHSLPGFSHARITIAANGVHYRFLIPTFKGISHNYYGREESAVDFKDPIVREVADSIAGNSKTVEEEAPLFLRFVQGIEYTADVAGAHFSKHPVRTIREQAGDCEDTSDLFVSLCRARGHTARRIGLKNIPPHNTSHAMGGIVGNFKGFWVEEQGVKYYVAETASSRWEIGDNPNPQKGIIWSVD